MSLNTDAHFNVHNRVFLKKHVTNNIRPKINAKQSNRRMNEKEPITHKPHNQTSGTEDPLGRSSNWWNTCSSIVQVISRIQKNNQHLTTDSSNSKTALSPSIRQYKTPSKITNWHTNKRERFCILSLKNCNRHISVIKSIEKSRPSFTWYNVILTLSANNE